MKVRIHTLRLGICTSYVVQSGGVIVIDAGAPGKAEAFRRGLEGVGLTPGEVQLLVLTHGHWDHIGSARAIQAMTGARIAMHEADRDCLEQAVVRVPPGTSAWSRFLVWAMGRFETRILIEPAWVDRVLGDATFSLKPFGVPGEVLPTPGHSPGSVSVLLETGACFVGDLAMSGFPLRLGPGLPIFADDLEEVRKSWRFLLERGVNTVYPAHGRPFEVDRLRRLM